MIEVMEAAAGWRGWFWMAAQVLGMRHVGMMVPSWWAVIVLYITQNLLNDVSEALQVLSGLHSCFSLLWRQRTTLPFV